MGSSPLVLADQYSFGDNPSGERKNLGSSRCPNGAVAVPLQMPFEANSGNDPEHDALWAHNEHQSIDHNCATHL